MNASDYDRFLCGVGASKAHVERIITRLHDEKKISRAVADVLLFEMMYMLRDAYMAGRCEPPGVMDVMVELTRVAA